MIIKNMAVISALSMMLMGSAAYAQNNDTNAPAATKTDTDKKCVDGKTSTGAACTGTEVNASGAADANANANTNAANTSANTGASADAKMNFGQAVSSIRASKDVHTRLQGMSDVGTVKVVKLSSLMQGQNASALDNALSANANKMELQTAISAKPKITAELQTQNIPVDKVVGADIAADNTVTLFVDDRS